MSGSLTLGTCILGLATLPARRVGKALSLGLLGAILGLSLFWMSDNPFALTFQTGAGLMAVGFMVAGGAALMMLFRSRQVLARIVAVSCIVAGLLSLFFVVMLAAKNRILWQSRLPQESWQQDVRYLSDLIVRVHPNAFAHVSLDIYHHEVADLQAQLSSLTDQQIEMRLVRLVAILQDGHSTLFPFQPATGFRMLPLQLFFEDRAPFYLLCPEVLQAEGIAPNSDSVRFSIEGPQGAPTEVDIEPFALTTYLY